MTALKGAPRVSMDKKRNRLEYLSIARGFGMLAVVLAHTFVPEIRGASPVISIVFLCICAYSMQLFIMLSGYLFQRSLEKYLDGSRFRFCFDKLKALIVPYLSMSVLSYGGAALAFMVPRLASVLNSAGLGKVGLAQAAFQIATFENHMITHLWFLPTLFLIYVVSILTGRFLSRPPGLIAGAALFLAAHYLPMPVLAYRVCALLIYFCIGRQMAFLDASTQKKWIALLIPVFLGSYAVQQAGWLSWSIPLEALIALVIGTTGALSFIAVSRVLAGRAAGCALSWVGENSFVIYLLHQPFIISGISGVLLMYSALPHLVICAITLVLGITIPCLADRFIISKARPLRWMFKGEFSAKKKRAVAQ